MSKKVLIISSSLLTFLLVACGVGEVAPQAVGASSIVQLEAVGSDTSVSSSVSSAPPAPPVSPVSPTSSVQSVQETAPTPPAPDKVTTETASSTNAHESSVLEENAMRNMQVTAGNKVFSATLEENDATKAFIKLMQNSPVVIQMSDNSGFEKVGSLGSSLPESNQQITAQAGDIILYNGNQIVVFYGSNSWSYTRLGRIDDLSGWEDALGGGDVTLTFGIK